MCLARLVEHGVELKPVSQQPLQVEVDYIHVVRQNTSE